MAAARRPLLAATAIAALAAGCAPGAGQYRGTYTMRCPALDAAGREREMARVGQMIADETGWTMLHKTDSPLQQAYEILPAAELGRDFWTVSTLVSVTSDVPRQGFFVVFYSNGPGPGRPVDPVNAQIGRALATSACTRSGFDEHWGYDF